MLAKILKYVILNPFSACVGMVLVAQADTVYSKKKKPARYVISIQISGERTAAAYVITVFYVINILQAEAEKLSGFTPSIIQPEAAGRGLYARCKIR